MKSNWSKLKKETSYNIWKESVDTTTRSAIAIVLFILHKRRWHAKDIIKFYEDFIEVISVPLIIFGKEVDDLDVQALLTKKYGIDFSRVKLRCASQKEEEKREKEFEKLS